MTTAREIAEGIIQLLEKRGQIASLGEIISLLSEYNSRQEKQNVAVVRTAVTLNESERKLLRDQLSDMFGRPLQLEEHVDESIIGGMYIQVGDTVLDYTVSSNINAIQKTLENS